MIILASFDSFEWTIRKEKANDDDERKMLKDDNDDIELNGFPF